MYANVTQQMDGLSKSDQKEKGAYKLWHMYVNHIATNQ